MQNTTSHSTRLHPIIWIAAGAVTLFSIVGIGKQMGWIGSDTPAIEAPAQVGTIENSAVPPVAETKPATEPTKQASAERSTPPRKVVPRDRPVERRNANPPVASDSGRDGRPNTTPLPTQRASQTVVVCRDCGVVESVTTREVPVAASGAGAVGGAVVGGALGNQVGEGSGKTAATVVGAILGGLGGHKVEQKVRTKTEYLTNVRMEDGSTQSFPSEKQPLWRLGDRVQVRNGMVEPFDTRGERRSEQL